MIMLFHSDVVRQKANHIPLKLANLSISRYPQVVSTTANSDAARAP